MLGSKQATQYKKKCRKSFALSECTSSMFRLLDTFRVSQGRRVQGIQGDALSPLLLSVAFATQR